MILLFWSRTAPKCTSDSRQGPHLSKVFKKSGPSSTPSFLVGWLQRSVWLSQICLIKDVSFCAKHWSDIALQNGNVWILNQRNIKYYGKPQDQTYIIVFKSLFKIFWMQCVQLQVNWNSCTSLRVPWAASYRFLLYKSTTLFKLKLALTPSTKPFNLLIFSKLCCTHLYLIFHALTFKLVNKLHNWNTQ